MRLLFVVNAAQSFFTHRVNWVRAAQAQGYEVHVAGPVESHGRSIRDLGVVPHHFPFVRGMGRPRKVVSGLLAGRRAVQAASADIVHVVGTQLIATLAPLLSATIAPRLILSVTGLGHAFLTPSRKGQVMQWITALGYSAARLHPSVRFVFQNEDDLRTMRDFPPLRNLEAVLIRGSGVDVERFSYSERTPSENPTFIFPARLIREKGVHEFVSAVRAAKRRGARGRFVLVGDTDPHNPSAVSLEQLRSWQREGTVEWSGHSDDMAATFAACDAVVLPSYREGLPKALLEAASCGRALIATDVPGCREVVKHNETGLLAPLGDVDALADALCELSASHSLRTRLGRNARALVERELSAKRVTEQYLALYEHAGKR